MDKFLREICIFFNTILTNKKHDRAMPTNCGLGDEAKNNRTGTEIKISINKLL